MAGGSLVIDMTVTTEPWSLSLQEAGAQLRSGDLSAVELTESVLRRIEQTESVIHAYVEVLAEEALAAAQQADEALRAGRDRGPLQGLPIAIKDIYDVVGVPTRCGSRVREHTAPAKADAPSVARLREAGMIILGKTVTQEFAAGVVSPPARNPWDPSRIPGGSSGGSGAAVAAGSAPAAMGSDTGGSIRIPASVNGVVGLKPTYGLVSKRGVFPLSWSLDTLGPLTRTVPDAALILNALAGHDPADPTSAPSRPTDAMAEIGQDIRGLRNGVVRPFFFDRLQAGVAEAVEGALNTLRDLGAAVIDTPWTEASLARAAGYVINRAETAGVHGRGLREHPDLFGPELRLRLEASALFPAETYLHGQRARALVKDSMARLFRDNRLDAIVTPTLPATALPADDLIATYADGSREPVSVAYTRFTMPFNATGQPALSVPCGFDERGLPVGLQFAGRPFDEARLCRIGHAFERAAARPSYEDAQTSDER
jgi:aspartyl-tRNA(Asn)/glutamyl-tRNA(Gln) amidotransferase subunit A